MPEKNLQNKPLSQTFLAFDYGDKRTGVATGQRILRSATPLITLTSVNGQPDWLAIETLISEWRPQEIIVGIPDDSQENKALRKRILRFCRELEQRSQSPVTTHDETLSSDEAYRQLKQRRQQSKGKIDKHDIDQLAAALLLESWMNANLPL